MFNCDWCGAYISGNEDDRAYDNTGELIGFFCEECKRENENDKE